MKVVLDTNVLMSGIFWKGQPGKILELWLDNLFSLVLSEQIFLEYKRVSEILSKKYKANNIEKLLNLIAISSHFVETKWVEHPKCSDSDDNKFLATAVAANATYLITGDKALLAVKTCKNGQVITPKDFLSKID